MFLASFSIAATTWGVQGQQAGWVAETLKHTVERATLADDMVQVVLLPRL